MLDKVFRPEVRDFLVSKLESWMCSSLEDLCGCVGGGFLSSSLRKIVAKSRLILLSERKITDGVIPSCVIPNSVRKWGRVIHGAVPDGSVQLFESVLLI